MDNRGWVRLYRKILDSNIFLSPELLKVWIWCLLKATHKDVFVPIRTGKGITEVTLKPGQFVFGREQASRELHMKPSSTRNRIKKLEKMGNVTMQADSHWSVVTICNWEEYQYLSIEDEQAIGQPEDRQQPGKGQPEDTYKNNKISKEGKERTPPTPPGAPPAPKIPPCPHLKIIELYETILCNPSLQPPLKPIHKDSTGTPEWNGTNKRALGARWKQNVDYRNLEWWEKYFRDHVLTSDFLMGKKTDFVSNLGWLVKSDNFSKVLNGNYAKKTPTVNKGDATGSLLPEPGVNPRLDALVLGREKPVDDPVEKPSDNDNPFK